MRGVRCGECGHAMFRKKHARKDRKFCSAPCRARAWRKERVLSAPEAMRRSRAKAAVRKPRLGTKANPVHVRQCPECRLFWAADGPARRRSDLFCAKHRAETRRLAA